MPHDDSRMFGRVVAAIREKTGAPRSEAADLAKSVLEALREPTFSVKNCPRGCTELFSDEMQVCRGVTIDFGMSWSQQIGQILKEGAENGE